MKNIDFSKFADKFIDDAHNLLNELESKMLELEQSPQDQHLIEAVFRAMHTLKGIGAMFGFHVVSEYTHHLETIYDKIREKQLIVDHSIIQITFYSIDHLRNLLADRNMENKDTVLKHKNLLSQLEKIVSDQPAIKAVKEGSTHEAGMESENVSWYIQFICSEELIKRAVNIEYIFQDLSQLGTFNIFNHSAGITIL